MKTYEWLEENGRLKLYFPLENQTIYLDWQADYAYHARQHYALKKEPLAKALGLKGDKVSSVWDLTCGTGKDSLLMLAFGCRVHAFERQEVIFKLLEDAYRNLPEDLKERFLLSFGDARFLEKTSFSTPDVLYLDPMYEQKERKSLARKEMRLFRLIAGDDLDSRELLLCALAYAQEKNISRVVVKRPAKASPLLEGATASYEGKSTAYDMFRVLTPSSGP